MQPKSHFEPKNGETMNKEIKPFDTLYNLSKDEKMLLSSQLVREDMAKTGMDYSTHQISIGLQMIAIAEELEMLANNQEIDR